MNWRKHIAHQIKLVIWELDDTIWEGILSENKEVKLFLGARKILNLLRERGIRSIICSYNRQTEAESKLNEFGLEALFDYSSMNYSSKGIRIHHILENIKISEKNVLVIDHDAFSLLEVEHHNKGINLLHASHIEDLESNQFLLGNLEESVDCGRIGKEQIYVKENDISADFIKTFCCKLTLVRYKPEYREKVIELANGANILNYTKKAISPKEMEVLAKDPEVTVRCIQEEDWIGEKGFVGLFAMKGHELIHYLFSARVLGMGIEQRIYSFLQKPELYITNNLAVPFEKTERLDDCIEVYEDPKEIELPFFRSLWDDRNENGRTRIYVHGACDMFNLLNNLATPANRIVTDNNTYRGNYRAINIGTEYIRSSVEMSSEAKKYCIDHFYNYREKYAFNQRLFSERFDYIFLSAYDDFNYKIYVNKKNTDIRILRDYEPVSGDDNCILDNKESENWLNQYFYPPQYISEERYYENLQWIRDRIDSKTVLILVTGPEYDFYMLSSNPLERHNPELRKRIIALNKVMRKFVSNNTDNVRLVDVNPYLSRITHFTNSLFHWTVEKREEIALEYVKAMASCPLKKEYKTLLSSPIKGRKIVLIGKDMFSQISYYSLIANGFNIFARCGFSEPENSLEGYIGFEEVKRNYTKYFLIVADMHCEQEIKSKLVEYGFAENEDYILFSKNTMVRSHMTVV